jgi:nitroreductase
MTLGEAVRGRRTIRDFADRELDREELFELMQTAAWAPNHGAREPWLFDVFTGEGRGVLTGAVEAAFAGKPESLAQIRRNFQNVQVFIVVSMKQDPRQKQWEEDFAAAAAYIQTFQLLAWERGIGVVWKSCGTIYEPWFYEKLGINDGRKITAVLYCGYPETVPPAKERTGIMRKIRLVDSGD